MRETEYEKLLLKAETTLGTVSIIFFLITVLLITVFIPSDSLLFWVVFISSLSLLFIAIAICLEAERVTGWYECGKCHSQQPSGKPEGLDVSVFSTGSVSGLPVAPHPYG